MSKNSIKLRKWIDILYEFTATAVAINPGMLIELTSADKVQAHATAGGNVLPMFALEDELQGNDLNDAYAVSAKIQAWVPQRGEVVQAVLADGETAVIGSLLESNGDGYLRVHVPVTADSDDAIIVVPNPIVGIALVALDLSDSSGAETEDALLGFNKRIAVRLF